MRLQLALGDGSDSLIDEYCMVLVSRASIRVERDSLKRQLRVARAELREMAAWRLGLIAALPIAAAVSNQQNRTAAQARSSP